MILRAICLKTLVDANDLNAEERRGKRRVSQSFAQGGFTLIEIMVAILAIGILSAIAVPSWLNFVNIRRLNTAQGQVYRAMREAQSQASKHKSTWQVSIRENNNIIQWAIHPAEAGKFTPDALIANNNLWNNIHSNIRIVQERNNKGKSETTFRKETSAQLWRVMFNYQGCPIYEIGNHCSSTSLQALGQITLSTKSGGTSQRCVYLSTILGAMRTGKDHPTANDSDKYCY